VKQAEYLADVYDIVHDAGVWIHHCNDSRYCRGKGFTDLVIVGLRGVLWREVKASPNDRPTPEQTALIWLLKAAGEDARVWTVIDLVTGKVADEIAEIA